MKFKLYYLYVAYEVGMFFIEMKKRKASSIKLEFQEAVGKFNVYIDDSAFKTIDGKLGWQIIRTLYSTASKKAKDTFNKDESFDIDTEIKAEELKENFSLKLLPLTKGRCLSYSYRKKEGGVYEACIRVKSDNLKDFVTENIDSLNEKISNEQDLFFDYAEDGKVLMLIENVIVRADKIKLFLIDEDDKDHSFTVKLEDFESKSDVKRFFSRVNTKADSQGNNDIEVNTEQNEKETIKNVDISWEEKPTKKDGKDISWD